MTESNKPPKPEPKRVQDMSVDEQWHHFLTGGGEPGGMSFHHLVRLVPANPRCKLCNAPFAGLGAPFMRMMGRVPSKKNPHFCNLCENYASSNPGGAEVELSMLFIDVRGSTTLAEQMNATEFSRLMNRFYEAAIDRLVQADALVDKLVGDEVTGLFIPGYVGPQHAQRALATAGELLRACGYGTPGGAWIPAGVGVHSGVAWVGAVGGAGGAIDFTALGDNVNVTARLASNAGPGEALLSEAACRAAQYDASALERRELELKGKSEPVAVRVLKV